MARYRFTQHFENEVLRKHPYVSRDLCVRVLRNPNASMVQPDGRIRFWGIIEEFGGRALRVVTLSDGLTIHNAFVDRSFRP